MRGRILSFYKHLLNEFLNTKVTITIHLKWTTHNKKELIDLKIKLGTYG